MLIKWKANGKVYGESKNPVKPGYGFHPDDSQWGKTGATIYVPPFVFQKGQLKAFIQDIIISLEGYHCNTTIPSEKRLAKHLFYRYELSIPCDVSIGVSDEVYSATYVSAETAKHYKPDEVNDPFFDLEVSQT